MDIPLGGSSFPLLAGWIGIWNVGFVEGGKPEAPEKNPQSKHMNQQQTQPTCTCDASSAKPNPGHTSKRWVPPPRPFYPFVQPLLASTNKRLKKNGFQRSMSTLSNSYFKFLFLYTQVKETNSHLSGFLWLSPIHTLKKLGQCLEIKGK